MSFSIIDKKGNLHINQTLVNDNSTGGVPYENVNRHICKYGILLSIFNESEILREFVEGGGIGIEHDNCGLLINGGKVYALAASRSSEIGRVVFTEIGNVGDRMFYCTCMQYESVLFATLIKLGADVDSISKEVSYQNNVILNMKTYNLTELESKYTFEPVPSVIRLNLKNMIDFLTNSKPE